MWRIKFVFYLVISDLFIPSQYKTNFVSAYKIAGQKRIQLINTTIDQVIDSVENRENGGQRVDSDLSSSSPPSDYTSLVPIADNNTVVESTTSRVVSTEPNPRESTSERIEPQSGNEAGSTTKLSAQSSSSPTEAESRKLDNNPGDLKAKVRDIFDKINKTLESNNDATLPNENLSVSGDRSIIDQFNSLRKSDRKRGIEWNSTSEIERITVEDQTDYKEYKDKLKNETNLVIMASHGLFFNQYAQTLVFHETFEHFIRFVIPIKKELSKAFEKEQCMDFIDRSFKSLTILGDGLEYYNRSCPDNHDLPCIYTIPIKYEKICDRLVHYYGKQVEELQMIIDESYGNFKANLRTKRFIVTTAVVVGALVIGGVGGAVAGGIAGYFAGQSAGKAAAEEEIKKLSSVLEQMEKNIATINEGVQTNSRMLVGLSQHVVEMEKDLKNEMKLMSDNIRFQIQNLEDSISEMYKMMEEEFRMQTMVTILEDYCNLHLSSLRNTMILELQQIKTWETIFNTLSFGRLPKELLGYNQLKYILKAINQKTYTLFELALNEEEFPLYYSLPLVSYAVAQNEENYVLYLHLRVPLKIVRVNHRFNLVTVHPHPFPCLNDECILEKGKLKEGHLQSFDLPQLGLLLNTKTHQIQHQINMDYLKCEESGRKNLCFTFRPTTLQAPSSCIRAIYDWQETEIISWCEFKSAKREEYRVIPITFNKYMVHRSIVDHFTEFCRDLPTHRIPIEEWSEVIVIPEKCEIFISATNQKLLGPYSEFLQSTTDAKRITYESKLIAKINAKYSNLTAVQPQVYDSGRFIRSIEEKFQSNKNAATILNAHLSSEELSKVALFNIRAQRELSSSLANLNTKFKTYSMTGTLWGIVSLLGDSIQMITTLTVIFGILSYTNFFGIIGANLIIIHPRALQAWEINLIPDIKLLPPITVDVLSDTTAIAFFMNIAFVVLFIAFSILFVVYGVFRKVEYSSHYGKGPTLEWERERNWQLSPCCLMVHLNYRGNLIRCVKVENIHIKLYIDGLFSRAVKLVKVKNPLLSWGIIRKDGNLIIVISEPVALMGFDDKNERIEDTSYKIEIPIDVSAFNSVPRSEAIQKRGNNGMCFVDAVPKSLGVKMRAGSNEAPPRYIELMPSSPPMEEVYV